MAKKVKKAGKPAESRPLTTPTPRRFAQDNSSPKPIPTPNVAFVRVVLLGQRLQKYLPDVAAVALLFLALWTLAGLAGLSSGALTNWWLGILGTWFGWGAFIIPLTCIAIGLYLLADNFKIPVTIRWGRVISAEVALMALLGLFNRFGAESVAHAVAGEGGGLVGWGIGFVFGRILPAPADVLVLALIFLGGLFLTMDVTARRVEALFKWMEAQGFTPGTQMPLPFDRKAPSPEKDEVIVREARPDLSRAPAKIKLTAADKIRVPVEAADDVKSKSKKRDKRLPGFDLLDDSELRRPAQKDIDTTAAIIVKTLREFGIPVTVVGARVGPSVTQYQVQPGFNEKAGADGATKQQKVRVAQISSLADDLALALTANTLRIEAPVPGQSYVGIEVPHRRTSVVSLRPVMESDAYTKINSPLAVAVGRDVSGAAVAADLATMPHLLIAGTTGSGKSVCITALTLCLIANNTPDDLRMVMVDPKMVELVRFNGLPHLFGKVETELDRIIGVLRWTVREMERRYKVFEQFAVRNITEYNTKTVKQKDAERMPRLVVMIDELADLMMQAPDETERSVVRLAQMARATGIHLVVATQRPSVDVVTGLIKANFPARIAFSVASSIDSRVIIDQPGAESLLGRGDMLFVLPENPGPIRLQGCFVTDKEVDRVVSYWRAQAQDYADEMQSQLLNAPVITEKKSEQADDAPPAKPAQAPWDEMLAREAAVEDKDRQIEQAIEIVKKYGTASASLLQRKMRIGYPRAARLMDELKQMGIVGREQAGGKTREVFVDKDSDPIGDRAARILGGEDEDE